VSGAWGSDLAASLGLSSLNDGQYRRTGVGWQDGSRLDHADQIGVVGNGRFRSFTATISAATDLVIPEVVAAFVVVGFERPIQNLVPDWDWGFESPLSHFLLVAAQAFTIPLTELLELSPAPATQSATTVREIGTAATSC